MEGRAVAFGGSFEVDYPDAVTELGLTAIPLMDVNNGCATAATALQQTADAVRFGQYDIAVALMDKHGSGASSRAYNATRSSSGTTRWSCSGCHSKRSTAQ